MRVSFNAVIEIEHFTIVSLIRVITEVLGSLYSYFSSQSPVAKAETMKHMQSLQYLA